jgi:hypothetical protein
MKKVLFIFLMFFALSSFASNSLILKETKIEAISYENKNIENTIFQTALCYVTIYNSETGRTRRVYATGSGSTNAEAAASCGRNAFKKARELVDELNAAD